MVILLYNSNMSHITYISPQTSQVNLSQITSQHSPKKLSGRIMHTYTTMQVIVNIILLIVFVFIAWGISCFIVKIPSLQNFGDSELRKNLPIINGVMILFFVLFLWLIWVPHGHSFKSIIKAMCMKSLIFFAIMVVVEIISSTVTEYMKDKNWNKSNLDFAVGLFDLVLLVVLIFVLVILGCRDCDDIGYLYDSCIILDSDKMAQMKEEEFKEYGLPKYPYRFKIYVPGTTNQFKVIDGPEGPSVLWGFYGPEENKVTVMLIPGASRYEIVKEMHEATGYESIKTDANTFVD